MADLEPGIEPAFLGLAERFLGARLLTAGASEFSQARNAVLDVAGQRMVGGKGDEAGSENGVMPGGEDLDRAPFRCEVAGRERKIEPKPFTPTNPVALHDPDAFGPPLQALAGLQQFLGKLGNAEEPLCHLAALDQRVRAPSPAVDHLFVRQDRLIDRIPVDDRAAAVHAARFQKVKKQRLLCAVILDVAGGEFAAPVQGEAHAAQLLPHGGDVVAGPAPGMDSTVPGGVLGRKSERVPSHRVEDAETRRPLVTGKHVPKGVIAHMPDMDPSGRIRKHLEHIVLLAGGSRAARKLPRSSQMRCHLCSATDGS